MKKFLILTTFLIYSQSFALSDAIVCEDGNSSIPLRIIINLKLNLSQTSYDEKSIPCFTDPYDGYQCNYENPKKVIEEKKEVPSDLYIVSSLVPMTYKSIYVHMRKTLNESIGQRYTVAIEESFQHNLISLNIEGTFDRKFESGFEMEDENHQYVSVNIFSMTNLDQRYYLKCRSY